ncbi:acyl-CoA dehydrogenase family protein [Mycobacterium sp.]|uniref:acyl-CoA dehydrogenase family protein n=1 Tax=Mycobacterium sp. TaxID=1785 RepID=UPI003D128E1F
MQRTVFDEEHEALRSTARNFFEKECIPQRGKWAEQGHADRSAWLRAGELGLLAFDVAEEYGGPGVDDWRFNAVVAEEAARSATGLGLVLQNDVAAPYLNSLATAEQKKRWLPGLVTGETITAIGMSEPVAGSDLKNIATTARRDGDSWVLNGSKTFITSGILADLVIVVCRTDPDAGHKGFSLIVVEADAPGFTKGNKLDKIGNRGSDTAELFFNDARVPAENLLGEQGRGFYYLMHNLAKERLGIAVNAVASAERAYEITLDYAKTREIFGQKVGTMQANRFSLAEIDTKFKVTRGYVDRCIQGAVDGDLTSEEAAAAKWWATEVQWEIMDRCMQLHGGYGYINEYEIALLWKDARVQRLYGGTTEVMKDLIGRSLGL